MNARYHPQAAESDLEQDESASWAASQEKGLKLEENKIIMLTSGSQCDFGSKTFDYLEYRLVHPHLSWA